MGLKWNKNTDSGTGNVFYDAPVPGFPGFRLSLAENGPGKGGLSSYTFRIYGNDTVPSYKEHFIPMPLEKAQERAEAYAITWLRRHAQGMEQRARQCRQVADAIESPGKAQEKAKAPGMLRPSKDEYYMGIALAVAKRSNCLKRHYGAIIVNNDEIVATGYNGSPRGENNCCDKGRCSRMGEAHNSGNYADCFSVHAEQNAMLSAPREKMLGATLYLAGESYAGGEYQKIAKDSPCPICARMVKNAGIARIVAEW